MIGLGIDAVDLDRFRRLLERRPRLVERLYTPLERADLAERSDQVPGLAARFAAKEAAMKAMKVGIGSVRFVELEVLRADSGSPSLALHGLAADRALALGITSWHVSLTHTATVAAAIVVAA